MSKYSARSDAITLTDLRRRKSDGQKISMVTCYDSSFARLVDDSGIDMVLVGDSLGNVMLGYEDTIPVTLEHMIHHSAAVARTLVKPFLAVDMPFFSYKISTEQALESAGRLVQEGMAQAVKLEGGLEIVDKVKAITEAGIPVVGHLGLTPQNVHAFGGYKVQGRDAKAEEFILESAKALQDAGAFCLVLELVPAALAEKVTNLLEIPTIGIGAGPNCDGQVLVLQDLLGFHEDFNPKFLKKYANLGEAISSALKEYDADVKSGQFPTKENSF